MSQRGSMKRLYRSLHRLYAKRRRARVEGLWRHADRYLYGTEKAPEPARLHNLVIDGYRNRVYWVRISEEEAHAAETIVAAIHQSGRKPTEEEE